MTSCIMQRAPVGSRFQHHGQRLVTPVLHEYKVHFPFLIFLFINWDASCISLIVALEYTKERLVVFPCFCCCKIWRKNPSNVLSSRLLPPQLVPPSNTPTLSAPHMGT